MDSEMATLNAKNDEKSPPKNQSDESSKESVENGSGNNDCTVTAALPGYSLAEDSDIHGLKPILRRETSTARRVVWIVMFTAAIFLLFLQMYERVRFYIAKHHITKTDVLHPPHMDFPAVTVCNMNKYRVSAITKEDIAFIGPVIGLTDEGYFLKHSQHYRQQWVREMFVKTDYRELKSTLANSSFDMEEFTNRTGHRFEDMVVNCQWRGMPCDPLDWTASYTHHGVCYTFNRQITSSHNISKSGNGNGLRLMLNVEENEYIESADASDLGFMLEIHDQNQPPLVTEFGFGVTSGFHYLIAMKMQEVISLPYPYGSCKAEHDDPADTGAPYTISSCRIECETTMVYQECGCRLVESPNTSLPLCDHTQYKCALSVMRKLEATDSCTCANPCHSIEYIPLISALRLRDETVSIAKKNNPQLDKTLKKEDLAVLNIYYQAMSYDLIEMVPAYSIVALLCDLGGNMGLYVGASMMAIFQVFDRVMVNIRHKVIEVRKKWEEKAKAKTESAVEALAASTAVPPIITVEYIYGDGHGRLIKTLSI